jgi:hypothetical protein
MAKRLLARLAFSVVLLVAASINMASACSCMMSHPQKHLCNSDFGKDTFSTRSQCTNKHYDSLWPKPQLNKHFEPRSFPSFFLSFRLLLSRLRNDICSYSRNLERQQVFSWFTSLSRQISGQHLKIRYDSFVPHLLKFRNPPIELSANYATGKASLNQERNLLHIMVGNFSLLCKVNSSLYLKQAMRASRGSAGN